MGVLQRATTNRGSPASLHVFEKQFPGQTRGIPWLAAALDRIKDLDDWFEAELIAKQVEACFGLVFTGGEDSGLAVRHCSRPTVRDDQRRPNSKSSSRA